MSENTPRPVIRTPVAPDGHPLGPALPPVSTEGPVPDGTPVPTAGGTPGPSAHEPATINLDSDFEETILAEDASSEEAVDESDDRNSDMDAELGGDDETSSNWDPTDYGRPPEVSSLVHLGPHHCRVPTQVKAKDGSKVSCICGKTETECKRHKEKIEKGAFRGTDGYYVAMSDPARGFSGHGKLAFFYTPVQYEELRRQESSRIETLLSAQQDDISSGDEETTELARDARVSFGGSVEFLGTSQGNSAQVQADIEATRHNLEARTGGRSKNRSSRNNSSAHAQGPSYFGLEDSQERRWIFSDFDQVQTCLSKHSFTLKEVFSDKANATLWKNKDASVEDDSLKFLAMFGNLPEVPSTSKSSSKPKKSKPHSRPKKKKDNSDPEESSESDASSDSSLSSAIKRSKKKKPSKKKKGKARAQVPSRHRSSSSPSSSSSSESSSSSSSSSGRSSRVGRSRKKKNKASRRKAAKAKKSRSRRGSNLSGADASVGDKKHIHKMSITGRTIDEAMGPQDFRNKDVVELYNAAADISALPGTLGPTGSLDETSEDARNTTEMAATLIATAVGRGRRPTIHDSLWQGIRRHALTQIKDRESLFSFVKAVDKDQEAAFEKQDFAIQTLLFHRHYSERSIDDFLRNGLLPRLTRDSFHSYSRLLSTIRQLAFDHDILWEGGPAKAMLDFHSFRLLQIRRHALSRKMLILRTYAYLRDADAKAFYHESMTASLWDKIADLALTTQGKLPPDSGSGATPKASTSNPRCSHCRNATAHKTLKIDPIKRVCPFLALPQADARKAAGISVKNHKDNGGSFEDCCKAAIETFG
jgi:hypothetical protein